MHSKMIVANPRASRTRPRRSLEYFDTIRNFMKISIFRGHEKNLSSGPDLPLGIEMDQRMHFWIGLDLI